MHKVKFGSSRFDDWVESWVQDFRYTVSSLACQPYHCKIWKQGGLKGPLMERIGLHTRNVGLPISEKENWRQTTTVTQASEDRKEQATKQKQNEPSIQGSRWKRKLKRTEWTPMNANLRPMVSNELPQLRLTGQAWLPPPHNIGVKMQVFPSLRENWKDERIFPSAYFVTCITTPSTPVQSLNKEYEFLGHD